MGVEANRATNRDAARAGLAPRQASKQSQGRSWWLLADADAVAVAGAAAAVAGVEGAID